MSQLRGHCMINDQHKIAHLLSLLTTFLVEVDFFRFLTFWSFSGYRHRSQEAITFKVPTQKLFRMVQSVILPILSQIRPKVICLC